jgi:ribosome-associated protein
MDDLQVGRWTIPADELEERFETSGGPGGQHANRNETAVRIRFTVSSSSLPDEVKEKLTHRLGDTIETSAADTRSQFRNRATARRRLKEKIETALVEQPVRRRTWPTRASRIRRIESKRARGAIKRLRRRPNGHD